MRARGSVAIVTGGASGLGLATARRLAAERASVVIVDLCAEGHAIAAENGLTFIQADVTDEKQVTTALERAAQLGPLRILVNCAGVVTPGKVVGRNGPLSLEQFSGVVSVNLIGTFNVIRLAAPYLFQAEPIDGEKGVIVSTASVAAFDGQIGQAAYSASKGGIVAMTLPLAREFAAEQVRVMAIAPGIFRTPMLDRLPPAAAESLGQQVPHPSRLGEPAEFAELVAHIVANPMLNGEVIRLDGAIRMAAR